MSEGSTETRPTVDRRAIWLLGGLLVVGGVGTAVLFPSPPPAADGGSGSGFVAVPQKRELAPPVVTEEAADAPPPESEPFVETERVRGKVIYEEFSRSLCIEDDLGQELARLDMRNLTNVVVGSSFDEQARVVLVDLEGGRRLEIPEAAYEALPTQERDSLYYRNVRTEPPTQGDPN